jgi:DNA-binding GntR family transcriptional regulator
MAEAFEGQERRGGDLLHTAVARDLGIAIVQGKHAPGELLPSELTAVQALKISRPAYREAIRMLAARIWSRSGPSRGRACCPGGNGICWTPMCWAGFCRTARPTRF